MMFKSFLILALLFLLLTTCHGHSQNFTFIKTKASEMRNINPLKLFFNVVYAPDPIPSCHLEWNFSFLKTLLLESSLVSSEDKQFFLDHYNPFNPPYDKWTPTDHEELERFTEKYLDIYKSPEDFLPFRDCPALSYAIVDQMLNELQPKLPDRRRQLIRQRTAERLCFQR